MQAEEETKPEGSLHSNEGAEEENDMDYMGRVPDVAWGLPISDEEVAADNRGIYTVLPLHSKKGKLYAVCGGGDEVLRLLRFNEEDMSLDEVQVFDGRDKLHSDSITKVAVSADGHFIGAASMDGTVSLYAVTHNADDTVCLHHTGTLTGPEKEIEDIAWAPKGSVILASSADKSAWVWHAERGFVSVFTGHNAKVTKCAFVEVSAAREIACVTASSDGYVRIWDPSTGVARHHVQVCRVEKFGDMEDEELEAAQALVAVGTAEGLVALINVENGTVVAKQHVSQAPVESLAFGPASLAETFGDVLLAVGDGEGKILLLNCSTLVSRESLSQNLEGSADSVAVTCLDWIVKSDGVTVVSGGSNGIIKIWDARNGELKDSLIASLGVDDFVHDAKAFPIDGDFYALLAGLETGSVNVWQVD